MPLRRLLVIVSCALVAAHAPHLRAQPAGPAWDLILRGGTVIDGTGAARYRADVAIHRGVIAAVGDLGNATATTELDVRGLVVSPGFLNIHSHAVPSVLGTAVNMLTQGVTTELLNADGRAPRDIADQLARYAAGGLAVNIAASGGFNSAWASVMGPSDRRPSADDIARMQAILRAQLEQGAFGISAGLDYKPAYFATEAEAASVLSVARGWRTFLPNHDRLTPESGFSSRRGMQETVAIARAAEMVPVFTHMKLQGHEQGMAAEVLQFMSDEARAGRWIAADAYPYLAGQTSLAALIVPGWAQDGGLVKMRERFADSAQRRRIVAEADEAIRARFGDASSILLNESGRRLPEFMAEFGVTSPGDAVVRILETAMPSAILTFGAEDDLRRILAHPAVAVACDCGAWTETRAHPRGFGSYPRVLGRYVREQRVLTWEEAVHRMTALPASIMGLTDRGLLAPGMAADITVFDTLTVIDHATYETPDALSEGIRIVLVNGVVALRDGVPTGAQGGTTLQRTRHMPSRPPTFDAARTLRATARVQSPDAAMHATVDANVTHDAGARTANGAVRVRLADGTLLTATTLGVVQTAPRWSSITGILDTPDGPRAFTLTADAGALPAHDGGTEVILQVDGMPPLTGAHDAAAAATSSAATAIPPDTADADTKAWWALATALSADSMEGRDAGSAGYQRAANLVMRRFAAAGLTPMGEEDGWFQQVPLADLTVTESRILVGDRPLTFLRDVTIAAASAERATLDAPLAYRGYCGDDALGEVTGTVVVCHASRRPGVAPPNAAQRLAQRGAVGMIAIADPGYTVEPPRWPSAYARRVTIADSITRRTPARTGGFTTLTLNADALATIVAGTTHDAAALVATGSRGEPLPSFDLPDRITTRFRTAERTMSSPNVIGYLPGTDPALANEVVVVTAHLDGYGYGMPVNGDSLYNGTLDDAAYVALMIRLAERRGGRGFRRPVLFLVVTAEEKGLLGTRWFLSHPTIARERLVADINLDQLRPLFPLELLTVHALDETTLGDDARAVAAARGIRVQDDPEPQRRLLQRSDHWPFLQAGIPAVNFVFGYEPGSESERIYRQWYREGYHTPQDDVHQRIDWQAATDFNRFFYDLVERVASQDRTPAWKAGSRLAPRPR